MVGQATVGVPKSRDDAGAGDGLSFSGLYRDRHAEMVRLAYLLTSSTEVAQDVVQDSFVRLHAHWSSVLDPVAYLRRSVVNACHSHHRRVFRQRRALAARPRAQLVGLDADEIGDALARLPRRQRAALVLRFYHDLSEAETAAVLGCRPGTVGSLVFRGLAQLREVIER